MKTALRLPPHAVSGYRAALVAVLLAQPAVSSLRAAEPAAASSGEAKEPEKEAAAEGEQPLRNWIEFGVGGTLVRGDDAAFQSRSGLPQGAFGGVESFHFEQALSKDGKFAVDGRGIFDNHDYSVRLELAYPEKGYVKLGYSEFRTWYDGSGGYFPPSETWFDFNDDPLSVDRSELWFEAGLRLPKVPELTFRYERQTREGSKGSLVWGETTQTAGLGTRSIVPAFWDIDEVRDIFAIDARHTLGRTTLGLGLRYEIQEQNNTRNTRSYPGEPGDQRGTQSDGLDTDLFNVHASAQSWLRSNVLLTAGYAFTDLDSDLSGYRVYGTAYDPDLAQRLPNPNTYQSLAGGSQMSQHVFNLNLFYQPWETVAIVPSARVEKQDLQSVSHYGQPAAPLSPTLYEAASERGLLDVSEALEVRYTGLTNWVFFVRGSWLQGQGDLDESQDNLETASNVLSRSTDDERFSQKYAAGLQWYPHRRVNLGAGYYYKLRNNDYDHTRDSTPNTAGSIFRYPAFLVAQQFETQDFNAKATWRLRNNLTLVARYDYQISTIQTQGDNLAEVESAEITSHILGGSVSWVPFSRFYLQGNINYVVDDTDTPADDLTRAVTDADNSYWNASVVAGFALDDKTDLSASYFYYRADDYLDNSLYGQPYGVGAEEQGVTAALSRELSRRIRWTLRYGFLTSHDQTSGGNNDYSAHLVYSTLQYRF